MPGARRSVATARRTVIASGSAVLLNETFTGSISSAWATPEKSTGAIVDVNTNQLRMVGGTIGAYRDYMHLSSVASYTDFEMTADMIIPAPSAAERFCQIGFRGSGVRDTTPEYEELQTTGYFIEVGVGDNVWGLFRRTAGATVGISPLLTVDWLDGDIVHFRINVFGSSIKVRMWRNATTEPSTWDIDTTNALYATGKIWLSQVGGNDTTGDTIRFDNVVITVATGNPVGALARTLDPLRMAATGSGDPGGGQSGLTFAQYQTQVLAERKGYALFGSVTGGQSALSPTVVTTTADSGAGSLRAALTGGSNRWIVFDRTVFPKTTETTITLSSTIDMRSVNNITLDGFGARVKIVNRGITTATFLGPPNGAGSISNNLIFANLKFADIELNQGYDCLTVDGTDRAWFHHLDLSGGGDGNLDITNVFAGPNNPGYMTVSNCYIHDSKTGKNSLFGDQSEGYGDYIQTSSSFPNNGGDNRITVCDSRFKDVQRNPIAFNYWLHQFNNYYHGWTLEGPTVMGGMGQIRVENCVLDGTGAGGNAFKGIFTWTFDYADDSKQYKRWQNVGNVFLGGATQADQSNGFLNPSGSIFAIPYSYTPESVSADAGAALIARLTSSTLSTLGRAGCVDRNGYYDLVDLGGGTGYDFTVGVDGTLQQILNQSTAALTNKRVRVPAGVWADNNSGAGIYFVNKDFGGCTVVLEAGATLRGPVSGIEMYGQILNLTIQGPGTIEGNGTQTFSEGINIDSTRSDKGANGNAGGNIIIDGVTVQPQAGTGPLQRNGVAIWGCDRVTVKNSTIHDCGSNAFAGFGSAGSGISIGHARRLAGGTGTRVLIDNNHIYNVLEVQDGVSADRNGIILDLFHGGFTKYADYLIGDVVVSNNIIHDVSGRGIQDLCGGLSDSLVTISGNQIYGQWARRLGGSAPEAAIGGYGAGTCANVICSNNTVTFDSGNGGKPAFYFFSFDGDGPGVFGSNNHTIGSGTAIAWENSRTNTPPAGFVT